MVYVFRVIFAKDTLVWIKVALWEHSSKFVSSIYTLMKKRPYKKLMFFWEGWISITF